jgi:hypothetical protein
MTPPEHLVYDTLRIEITESADELRLDWRGKSNDRHPEKLLGPLMAQALGRCEDGRALVLDFHQMEYMNSSTFTPVVKMLEQAIRGVQRVRLEYSGARKWQALSFSALKSFETADGRVSVHAK